MGSYEVAPEDIGELAKLISSTPALHLPDLLEALLTNRELVDIIRRILIAKMVLQDKTYDEINQETKAASSTISLVKQSLAINDGILTAALGGKKPSPIKHRDRELDPVSRYLRNRIRKGKWQHALERV